MTTTPTYPNDPTGDALRSIAESGSDMNQPMEIEYHIFVEDQAAGDAVSTALRAAGLDTEVWCDEETDEWTCTCYKTMLATYDGILETEAMLAKLCEALGGTPDGWGTYGNADDEEFLDDDGIENDGIEVDGSDDEEEAAE